MCTLKRFLILSVMFMALPANAAENAKAAAEEAQAEYTDLSKTHSPSNRVERPKREAVKLSPTIRVSPQRPDEDGKMRRIAPARGDSPLLNMPAPKDMTLPHDGEPSGGR